MNWLDAVVSTDVALLPDPVVQRLWMPLGWSIVLAWLAVTLVQRARPRADLGAGARRAVALVVGLWAWVPGTVSPTYWLGLVFQSPSALAMLLCGGALLQSLLVDRKLASPGGAAGPGTGCAVPMCAMGVLTGWALLLDSFALLPLQLYAWGFSPVAPGLLMLVALMPTRARTASHAQVVWQAALVPLALVLMVALRVPTGNAWDAVLDPLLWLWLHLWLLLWAKKRYRKNSR